MNEKTTPQREQLLSAIFDIVKEQEALSDDDIIDALQKRNIDAAQSEVGIALCMLQGRGLIEHFTKEAESSDRTRPTKRPQLEFLYKAADPRTSENVEPAQPQKTFFARLLGLE